MPLWDETHQEKLIMTGDMFVLEFRFPTIWSKSKVDNMVLAHLSNPVFKTRCL